MCVREFRPCGLVTSKPARLTPLLDFIPHFLHLPLLKLGCGGVEAADLVVLFVGEDGVGEGLVFGFGHLIFGD